MADLDTSLATLRTLVPHLVAEPTRGAAAREFCTAFYDVYGAVRQDIDKTSYRKVLLFLNESAEPLRPVFEFIGQELLNRIERGVTMSFQGTEWLDLCAIRSTFEGLRELYEDYVPIYALMPEPDAVDARLIAKGEEEGFIHPDLTPTTFPDTHWWWTFD